MSAMVGSSKTVASRCGYLWTTGIDHEPVPPPTSSKRGGLGEVEALRQGGGGADQDALDPVGGHLLKLLVDLEDLWGRSSPEGISKPAPGGVADLVPEVQEGTQVDRGSARPGRRLPSSPLR